MAHEVCKHGQQIMSVVSTAGIPELRRKMTAAQTQLGSTRSVLDNTHSWKDVESLHTAVARELTLGGTALAAAIAHVRLLEGRLERIVGDLGGELLALITSSRALADRRNVDVAEEFAASAWRHAGHSAYGEWGAQC